MNLLAYLQRFGLTEVSSLLLFLTDWEHVKNTGLQATKLRWDRQDGRVRYEGELTAKPLGTRWQAAENVLDATFRPRIRGSIRCKRQLGGIVTSDYSDAA